MTNYEQELEGSFENVIREADSLYEGHGRLQKTYDRLAARFEELDISYCLVGGYALILHEVRRFTEDIDILLQPDRLPVLREQLIGQGYVSLPGSVRSIRDAETGVRIDFILAGDFPGDGKPKPVAFPDPSRVADPGKGKIHVVTLATLIELKLASGMTAKDRLQDLADVQRLIDVHELDEAYAEQLHPYVRDRFVELCRTTNG
jgi:hypothetical protein